MTVWSSGIVRLLMKSSAFTDQATQAMMRFVTGDVAGEAAPEPHSPEEASRRNICLGIYVKALVTLSTGSSGLGTVAQTAVKKIAAMQCELVKQSRQGGVSFVTVNSRASFRDVFNKFSVINEETRKLFSGNLDILMIFILLSLTNTFSPAVFAMALLFTLLTANKHFSACNTGGY